MKKSNKICGIYSITLASNGRQYIGSSVNIYKRWQTHKMYLRKNKHHSIILQNSWNKYVEESFVFEILEECESVKEIILEREQFYIDNLNTYFNVCKIAGNTLGVKLSDETKIKIGKANKGKLLSSETKKRMSESKKGEKNPYFGNRHSNEILMKISESSKGRNNHSFGKFGKDSPVSKKYIIVKPDNKLIVIISLNYFCNNNNLTATTMVKLAKGKNKHHKNHRCFYYSDEKYQELLELYPQEQYEQAA